MSAHDHRTGLLVPVPPNHFISQIEDMVAKRQPRDISLDRLRALQEWRKSGEYQNACLVGPESNISVEELEWMIKSAMDAWEEIEKQWGLDESGKFGAKAESWRFADHDY
jgi:muconolactone delta-isomerase